ncbi:MAG: radical SAM protein [Anaerolineaceae bacterium]|nr:MAG: radical SAM protein [Anaerolineaceae bacterium]
MKYVFGPVPSRRLGQSLGIDPIPLKTCNWNCVYCQLGRTMPLTLERGEYAPRHELLAEVEQALAACQPGEIDWATFVGSGEPTLHSGLGWMIRQVKAHTDLPVAVITNGSLLFLPEVRDELLAADAVLPTLDAGNAWLYRQINRAAPRFTFERLIEGIEMFRKVFTGRLWIETMLVKGMNDTAEALGEIALVLERLQPDHVHITLPIRPPAEAWVRLSDEAGVRRAEQILGKIASVSVPSESEARATRVGDLAETVLSIVTRHPMREAELLTLLNRWSADEVRQALQDLAGRHQVRAVDRDGLAFWSAAAMSFHTSRGDKK